MPSSNPMYQDGQVENRHSRSLSSDRSQLTRVASVRARSLSSFKDNLDELNNNVELDPELLQFIREDLIGNGSTIHTPMGKRKLVYCDYVASGRAMKSVEDFIQEKVLPTYANTHTDASLTGRYTNYFREQARHMIAESCGVDMTSHAIIFTGAGCTAAIDTLVRLLPRPFVPLCHDWSPTQKPKNARQRECPKPAVIITAYEHHSNILPWRESNADVYTCSTDPNGKHGINLNHLEAILKQLQAEKRPQIIGSFSAASNVDGTLTNVNKACEILKKYDAIALFDYAAAGPYVPINVRESGADGLFISPHKFIGGPGTPGILIIRRSVVTSDNSSKKAPHRPGGGSVTFVNSAMHAYEPDLEVREEAGTPDIVASIRAGLVFKVKDDIRATAIMHQEDILLQRARERLSSDRCPNLIMLGNLNTNRLPTLSFVVAVQGKVYVHQNFVCTLLNDLFGIQSRSGCACAGPYGASLMGIDDARGRVLLTAFAEAASPIFKPGFTRVNLPFFSDDTEIDFVLEAIAWVSENAPKLLPLYTVNIKSGSYKAVNRSFMKGLTSPDPKAPNLLDYNLASRGRRRQLSMRGSMTSLHEVEVDLGSHDYSSRCFEEANELVTAVANAIRQHDASNILESKEFEGVEDDERNPVTSPTDPSHIWFLRKGQAISMLRKDLGVVSDDSLEDVLPDVPLFRPNATLEDSESELALLSAVVAQATPVKKEILANICISDPMALGLHTIKTRSSFRAPWKIKFPF